MGKCLLLTKLALIVVAVFFQVVTVIAEGTVQDMLLAETTGFKYSIDMAIPDGDPIGAGDQRSVTLLSMVYESLSAG